MDHSSRNSVTFFTAISKYAIVILELMTEFIKMMFEYFWRSGFSFKYRVKFRIKNSSICRVVVVTT